MENLKVLECQVVILSRSKYELFDRHLRRQFLDKFSETAHYVATQGEGNVTKEECRGTITCMQPSFRLASHTIRTLWHIHENCPPSFFHSWVSFRLAERKLQITAVLIT